MWFHRVPLLVVLACSLCLSSTTEAQVIRHVDANSAATEPDGQGWATAFQDLQAALAIAESGDEIWVADGTYYPDGGYRPTGGIHTQGDQDPERSFHLIDGVGIYGGFEGGDSVAYPGGETVREERNSDSAANATILSGNIDGDDTGENSHHVVVGSGVGLTAILDGFTITDGRVSGDSQYSGGGGVLCASGSPTLKSCTIRGNRAYNGSGICCYGASNPRIMNCSICNNTAPYSIGAMTGAGVAICCYNGTNPTLTNCAISGNAGEFGAVHCRQSSATLINCTIGRNTGSEGAGVHCSHNGNITLINCTISGNAAAVKGGGVYCESSVAMLTNCILWGNQAGQGPEIYLCDHYCAPSTIGVSYCVVEGGEEAVRVGEDNTLNWGEGNTATDPLLARDGVHLRAGSPCLETCDPAGDYTTQVDIDGEPRVVGERADIGADEFVDSDADGLPDWWESLHFGSPTAGDPTENEDGDGRLNIDEYVAGSHPFQAPLTYYVDLTGDDAWDGLAPAWDGEHGPKATIQAAIDATVMYEGDEIVVADGTYTGEGNRELDFNGREITLRSAGGASVCIIDCEEQGRGVYFHNGETERSVLRGFTIRGGLASGWDDDIYGGGVHCHASSPTLADCTIIENTADHGGGVSLYSNSNPTLSRCTMSENTASGGGGIYCGYNSNPTLISCVLNRNAATFGGGACCTYSEPVLTNCVIMGNIAGDGGGVYCGFSETNLKNCVLWGNTAPDGPEICAIYSSSLNVSYSVVEGGETAADVDEDSTLIWGDGNITADPLLTRDGTHLRPGSPCLEAGDPTGDYTGQTDIDGEPRWISGGIDIGPDEFLDSDSDGLPDWWESHYFDSPTAGSPTDNADGDGRSNFEEYCLSSHPLQSPQTLYVNLSGNDGWDGLSPAWNGEHGPKATIQAAIDATTRYEGDEIIVANGTYTGEGNRELDFGGREITLRSAGGAEACILDCEEQGRGLTFHRGETALSIVKGFTITAGHASSGGGVALLNSSPTIMDCMIIGNTASYGGGVYCGSDSTPTLTNCMMNGNAVNQQGGGLCCSAGEPTLTNCIIIGNRASRGGGLLIGSRGTPTLTNSILWGNSASFGMGALIGRQSALTVSYSTVENGETGLTTVNGGRVTWGPGNIEAHPLFMSPGHWDDSGTPDEEDDEVWINGDYHLQTWPDFSPCIDAGDNAAVTTVTDMDGYARRVDVASVVDTGSGLAPIVDMGVYEAGSTCVGDLDFSGRVDIDDVTAFIGVLLDDETDSLADVNEDGSVNGLDIQALVDMVLANDGLGTPC